MKMFLGGERMQIYVLIASVAYWIIIGAVLLVLSTRVSRIGKKIKDIESKLKKE